MRVSIYLLKHTFPQVLKFRYAFLRVPSDTFLLQYGPPQPNEGGVQHLIVLIKLRNKCQALFSALPTH